MYNMTSVRLEGSLLVYQVTSHRSKGRSQRFDEFGLLTWIVLFIKRITLDKVLRHTRPPSRSKLSSIVEQLFHWYADGHEVLLGRNVIKSHFRTIIGPWHVWAG